jgi:hypothetical protein
LRFSFLGRWRESNPTSALKTLKLLILRMPENCRIPRLPGLRTNRVQRISGTPRIPAVASSDPFRGRSEVFSDLYTPVPFARAGAEGFEVSFPNDPYAIFFMEFNSQTPLYQEPAGIPKLVPVSQLSHPVDNIPQEFGITAPIGSSVRTRANQRCSRRQQRYDTCPCWHRLRQCGRCTSKWHSGP